MASVSVIVPTFNRKDLVCGALDSVFAQTFRDFELLVIDDGSTDGTFELLQQTYGSAIRLYRQSNLGAAAARNRGMDEARGRFIAFLDSDDTWKPEKLERQISAFQRDPDLGLVYCGFEGRNERGELIRTHIPQLDGMIADQLLFGNHIGGASVVVLKKECANAVGRFDGAFSPAEDHEYWIRFCRRYKAGFTPEPLVLYLSHRTGISQDNGRLERADRAVLQACLAGEPDTEEAARRKNRVFQNLYTRWARIYCTAGNDDGYRRCFVDLLHCRPDTIYVDTATIGKEELLALEALDAYCRHTGCSQEEKNTLSAVIAKSCAYAYYSQRNTGGFSRCFLRYMRHDSPRRLFRNTVTYCMLMMRALFLKRPPGTAA